MSIPAIESPFFDRLFPAAGTEPALLKAARDLQRDGFAVIDFADADFDRRAASIRERLHGEFDWDGWRSGRERGLRVLNAWKYDADVRHIATNPGVCRLLEQLYGKPAFAFQTLNFPVGTQQPFHSDCAHFSSVPERYMCGVWVALEDIHADAGPLFYYPGSHRLPVLGNAEVGARTGHGEDASAAYLHYLQHWEQLVAAHGFERVEFLPRKGQALIWAANLLHGGAVQRDRARTRWSQVTHYYFRGCAYYTPLHSQPFLGNIEFKRVIDIATGEEVPHEINGQPVERPLRRAPPPAPRSGTPVLPPDFDDATYLALHPDVAAARIDPRKHFLAHGWREGRTYKRG